MALTIVNGITDVYVTETVGTVTSFIRNSALTGREQKFVADAEAARGGDSLKVYLQGVSYDHTNQNAWEQFGNLAESYDSAGIRAIVSSDFVVAAPSTGMVEAELIDLIARVNALQAAAKAGL